jgi:hypothetical protein
MPAHPHPGGLRFPLDCKADWLAVVDISRDIVWLFPITEAIRFSGGSADGLTYLSWYAETKGGRKNGKESDFEDYRLDSVIGRIIADAKSPETETEGNP